MQHSVRRMRLVAVVAAGTLAAGAEAGQAPLRPQGVVQLEGAARQSKGAEPLQSPAGALEPVPVTQLDKRARHADLDGSRISLSFGDPTPIRDILLLLVRDTRLSVIPDPALEQQFVGDLKNVTVREALDLILEPLGLDYSIRGNVIRVFPRELVSRLFSIDYVITQRTGSRSLNASTGAQGGSGIGGGAATGSGGSTGGGGGAGGGGGSSA